MLKNFSEKKYSIFSFLLKRSLVFSLTRIDISLVKVDTVSAFAPKLWNASTLGVRASSVVNPPPVNAYFPFFRCRASV